MHFGEFQLDDSPRYIGNIAGCDYLEGVQVLSF
jgi:hypothetical protein